MHVTSSLSIHVTTVTGCIVETEPEKCWITAVLRHCWQHATCAVGTVKSAHLGALGDGCGLLCLLLSSSAAKNHSSCNM